MTTIRLTPKQTTVREGWQWTGQPCSAWPAWVQAVASMQWTERGYAELIFRRWCGDEIVPLTTWLVLVTAADGVTDVTPYTDDELWKEFER